MKRKTFTVKIDFKEENDFCESDLKEALRSGLYSVGNYQPSKITII